MSQFKRSLPYHITGLDELRGIAVLAVLIPHAAHAGAIQMTGSGAIGVDLFFVISGFLITKILLRTPKDAPGYFRNFYIRRFFRIVPLAALVILFGISVSLVVGRTMSNVLPYYLTFTQNFIPTTPGLAPSSPDFSGPLPGCGPLWSLAVEEQFYLVLPLLVWKFGPKHVPIFAVIVTVVGLSLRYFYLAPDYAITVGHDVDPNAATNWYLNPYATPFRMQYLALGVLLACKEGKTILPGLFVFWLALVLIKTPFLWLEPVLGLVMVFAVQRCIAQRPLIKSKLLAHFGVLCFGLYCLNWPIVALFELVGPAPIWAISGTILGTYIAALVSFHYFELPLLKLRSRFERHAD